MLEDNIVEGNGDLFQVQFQEVEKHVRGFTEELHPEGLTDAQERLAGKLFDCEAIRFGDFTLKSGIHSPVYVDLRMLSRFPDVMVTAVDAYEELLGSLGYDLIAAIPVAAVAPAALLSARIGVGMVIPRIEEKGHGSGAKVDGSLKSDRDRKLKAVLLDDLITKATSKLEAADVLIGAGFEVEDVVVLINREQGGEEQLDERGIKLHYALTLNQLLKYYVRIEKITPEQYVDTVSKLYGK